MLAASLLTLPACTTPGPDARPAEAPEARTSTPTRRPVSLGDAEVETKGAGLTTQEVKVIVRANRNMIESCFVEPIKTGALRLEIRYLLEDEQPSPPRGPDRSMSLGGVATDKPLDLAGNGRGSTRSRVTRIGVESVPKLAPSIRGCIAWKIRRWAHPKLRGETPFEVRLVWHLADRSG